MSWPSMYFLLGVSKPAYEGNPQETSYCGREIRSHRLRLMTPAYIPTNSGFPYGFKVVQNGFRPSATKTQSDTRLGSSRWAAGGLDRLVFRVAFAVALTFASLSQIFGSDSICVTREQTTSTPTNIIHDLSPIFRRAWPPPFRASIRHVLRML